MVLWGNRIQSSKLDNQHPAFSLREWVRGNLMQSQKEMKNATVTASSDSATLF